MRLTDRDVSFDQVKRALPFDADLGCSLADVARAAEALGLSVEMRYVNPRDLPKVPRPFMLHQNVSLALGTGHFVVVVGYAAEPDRYTVIDTTYDRVEQQTERMLLRGYSGYVLVPCGGTGLIWNPHLPALLLGLGFTGAGVALVWAPVRRRLRKRASSCDPCRS
jgi:ABC-type bacteriocin/lantibiotic exporter with double-glycine peptidase domain